MPDMEVTTEYYPTGTGEYFRYYDAFVGISYALKMTERFSFGTTFKVVEEHLAGLEMTNWMIDIGTFYWTGFRSLRFAAAVVNFGPDLRPDGTFLKRTREGNFSETGYEAFSPPTTFRVGTAMEVVSTEKYMLTTSFQINHPVDNAENAVIGLDFGYIDRLFLRGGYRINYDEERFTYGAGFILPVSSAELTLDYSYKDFINLGATHQFTLGFQF
jgi:hypothetical protein